MAYVVGRLSWSLSIDDKGYRTYKIKWLVKDASGIAGPRTVSKAAGLPTPYSKWDFNDNTSNDYDRSAFCYPTMEVQKAVNQKEPDYWWTVEQTFSNKSLSTGCDEQEVDNPLLMPDRISGTFTKYTQEATRDAEGKMLISSSHELFRGSLVERDFNRPQVTIERNVPYLDLYTYSSLMDSTNDSSLWGLPIGCVKLSEISWSRENWGECFVYYTVSFTFDCQYSTFTRYIPDRGTQVLKKGGNKNNLKDFEVAKDDNGENKPSVLLNGEGEEAKSDDDVKIYEFNFYPQQNLYILGIPGVL